MSDDTITIGQRIAEKDRDEWKARAEKAEGEVERLWACMESVAQEIDSGRWTPEAVMVRKAIAARDLPALCAALGIAPEGGT